MKVEEGIIQRKIIRLEPTEVAEALGNYLNDKNFIVSSDTEYKLFSNGEAKITIDYISKADTSVDFP